MKFLIQKVNGKITHDFSFALLKAIEFQNWIHHDDRYIRCKYLDTKWDGKVMADFEFKPFHKNYIPIGSVEFVMKFLWDFHKKKPKPINIPDELLKIRYTQRKAFNGTAIDLENCEGKWFFKDMDVIKDVSGIIDMDKERDTYKLPKAGNYQFSEYVTIESEWRAFVFKNNLIALQHYCGDFTMFPNVDTIKNMITGYKSAPVAYTLDVGVKEIHEYFSPDTITIIIEVHDFFSCGLYGFSDYATLPFMFARWFYNYVNEIQIY